MRLLFSPNYSGNLFAKPATGSVMMDTEVVGTMGLVETLELRLGLHYETTSRQQNLAHYYDAMNRYMQAEPGNCLASSFQVSGLKTAQAVMMWRDELRAAQWDGQGAEISNRLKAMVEIEKLFRPNADKDLAERIGIVVTQLECQQLDCSDTELLLNCDPTLLRPLEKSLLDALQKRGAKVELQPTAEGGGTNLANVRKMMTDEEFKPTELNANDESLLVYRFSDRQQANEYLASTGLCGVDVCIDSDNKALDHQLRLMGHPLSGSNALDSAPQLTQLLVVGIGLFYPTLNINTLLQWLDMPLHPLGGSLRFYLSNAIAKNGGYRNSACQEVINKYINGDYLKLSAEELALPADKQLELRRKDMKKRSNLVDTFLPPMTPVANISRKTLKDFTAALASWCRQTNLLRNKKDDNDPWREQLSKVVDMADTFSLLLDTVDTPTLDQKTVESWLSALDKTGDFACTCDERGCTVVVPQPANVVTVANRTLWADFNGNYTQRAECTFLTPSEKEALARDGHIDLWGDNEASYRESQELIPLLHTSGQLILVVCERHNEDLVPKHPLLIRLEQQFGEKALETITRRPSVDPSLTAPVDKIRNERASDVLDFNLTNKFQWPGHLSPTYIRTLVDDPFSYMMDQLLDIRPDEKAAMQDIRTTSGNVAHKVIETFFSPTAGGPKPITVIQSDIAQHYNAVFDQTVNAIGAVLLLQENLLELMSLRIKLHRNLETLCDIINNNNLSVVGCETPIKGMSGFGLPEEIDETTGNVFDTKGFIDMVLEDSTGHPVVFDFKWTLRPRYYREMLENNDSIQLEFYRHMLQDQRRTEVRKVAYFLMPYGDGCLYSLDTFVGNHCIKVETENDINVVTHTVERVCTNKAAIDNGKVDVSTIGKYSDYKMFVVPTEDK